VLVRIQQVTGGALQIPQGSLYPALYRLEHQGKIASEWGTSDNNRKAKYYKLTAAGRKYLRKESESWNRLVSAISSVMSAQPGEV
jgi:transcriptional regulator